MSIEHIEVLVEEPSMEAALRLLLPRVLGECSFDIHVHQCKHDLLKHLLPRLRGYANWIPSNWRIVVIVDRDDDDCRVLKDRLNQMAWDAGLATRPSSGHGPWSVVNRIAVEELESWYFGDWQAVLSAYPKVPPTIPYKAKYRDPDAIRGGTWEAFERILRRAGYFVGGLRKIEAAKAVAEHMRPERNTSHSFRVLLSALCEQQSLIE